MREVQSFDFSRFASLTIYIYHCRADVNEQVHGVLGRDRIAAATALLILVFAAVSILVRTLALDSIGVVVAFVLGLILTPIIASPIEWLVHRYIYHRRSAPLQRIYAVHLAHHHLYFPTWRYITGGPARRIPILALDVDLPQVSRWKNALTYFAHFIFYMTLGAALLWLPMWLVSRNVPFTLGAILGTTVISNLFIIVHDSIHRPGSHHLLEAQSWFRFLDEHHYIHHVDTEANVNFLLPLTDWLFGTLRRTLTSEELSRHGSREAAKSRVVGMGEPAAVGLGIGLRLSGAFQEDAYISGTHDVGDK